MSKRIIKGAAVAAAAVLAVVGLAGPAQATSASVETKYADGEMKYNDTVSADYFQIIDWNGYDEYGVRGEIRSGGGTLLSWNYVPAPGEARLWYYDLAKGKSYVMRVCLASGAGDTTPINCISKVINDTIGD